jgi:hypothetical protein
MEVIDIIKEGYTRVTDILAPFSGIDKIPEDILRNAAERGDLVHRLCEGIIEGLDVDIPDHLKGYVDSFRQWYDSLSVEFLPHPGRWYDEQNLITGKCDHVYKEKGILTIVDLKTSAKEALTWRLQGTFYASLGLMNK